MNDSNEPAISPPPSAVLLDRRTWLALFILIASTVALYWPVLGYDYIGLDDSQYAAQNPIVQHGLTGQGIVWAFTQPVASNWHPLTMISLMLDCNLWGAGPRGHHLVNMVLHALNTGLAFLFLRLITGAYWRSLLVAALFSCHPVHVESVAWISERKDVLSTFFWLLALGCYGLYARATNTANFKPKHFYFLALIFTALGLMSKAMLVTMPGVLLLLDYWPLNRFQPGRLKPLLREKIPFFILVMTASLVTLLVQQESGAVSTMADFPIEMRLGNALFSYIRYLGKLLWPNPLAFYYPYPLTGNWPFEWILAAATGLIVISVFIFWMKRPFLLTGWLWFLGTLVPVIGLVQVGVQAMADRYTYVPSIGIFIIICWGVYDLAGNTRPKKVMLTGASLAVIAAFCILTRLELGYWKNTESLLTRTLAVTDNNYIAHLVLGNSLLDEGRNLEAIEHFKEVIRLDPNGFSAFNNFGVALLREGNTSEAANEFQEAIRRQPGRPDAHYNLGEAYFKENLAEAAIAEFQETVRLNPNYPDAQLMLAKANALKANQAAMKGIQDLNNQAWDLATNPDPAKRDGAKAVTLAESACQQTQYKIPVLVGTLAAAYAEAGRFDEAVATAQKACDLAVQTGETNVVSRNQELMKLYQAHRAYHEGETEGETQRR